MGFIFDPKIKQSAQDWLGGALIETKRLLPKLTAVCDGPCRLRL